MGGAVQQVLVGRAPLISEMNTKRAEDDAGGRFVLYSPSEILACGAAITSSNGFFHTNNALTWDLWRGFSNGTFASFVPATLVDVVARGIFANPEECIRWR